MTQVASPVISLSAPPSAEVPCIMQKQHNYAENGKPKIGRCVPSPAKEDDRTFSSDAPHQCFIVKVWEVGSAHLQIV
jgi:hypothetical protein